MLYTGVVGNEMTNYYEILKIPNDASKHKTFRAFKKRYPLETSKDIKKDLLTGFLLIANERQKFLDILLSQSEREKELTPKYQKVILSERKKAEYVINDPTIENKLLKALKAYPFKEASSGLFWLFLYGADRYYFEISYVLILIGTIMMFQSNQDLPYIGLMLIAIGIYAHIRIVRNVKISKIKKITAYNTK
jgi:hypothetical protein